MRLANVSKEKLQKSEIGTYSDAERMSCYHHHHSIASDGGGGGLSER
jgi:hypothetical protein